MHKRIAITVVGACALTGVLVGPATASADVPWTWNSSDHDSKAPFLAYGELLQGVEYSGSGYIKYEYTGASGLSWNIPGSTDKSVKTLDLSIAENRYFGLQVCEVKTGLPDDCSSWQRGVS